MRFELDQDFIGATQLDLDADDLRLGVSLALISPATAVAIAADAVASESADPAMLDLTWADPSDAVTVLDALRTADSEDADLFPPSSVRKMDLSAAQGGLRDA